MYQQASVWSEELRCNWWGWVVLAEGQLALGLDDRHCCDMTAAIRIAEAVMPGVWRIKTFSGQKAGTEYQKVGGEWGVAEASPLVNAFNAFQRHVRSVRTEH